MRKILTVKNKDEDKFLHKATTPFDFKTFSRKEISDLVRMMRETMDQANGIGLSANQIGLNMRVFVARVDRKFYALFNPEIVGTSREKIIIEEGCLSSPDEFEPIPRAEGVTLVAYDKNGRKVKIKAWGLLARVFQHEVDHLSGKMFTDRIKRR
ncbi:MAG: peptide deformylase [Patescibacteria group bacterium]|nr:peptide deformylase [Patescibacteria group bacterium]MCL5224286.1 peptide deformylase [Patescibacteria group bacterium]